MSEVEKVSLARAKKTVKKDGTGPERTDSCLKTGWVRVWRESPEDQESSLCAKRRRDAKRHFRYFRGNRAQTARNLLARVRKAA